MTPRIGLLLALAAAGCSGLDEGEAGVVGIEVRVPGPDTVEVGESIQLSAKPLDKNGDSVGASVTWLSADAAATIDPATGVLTGVSPGTARVQATVGALGSALITFAVVPPADTLIIAGDSVFDVPPETPTSPPLVTRVESFNPAGALPGRGVIYAITSPDPDAATPTVTLTSGVVVDTITTAADGTATTALTVLTGTAPPDSVIVEVRTKRTRGAAVAGSGQRFIVRFLP